MKILVLAAEQSIGHADGRRSRRIASLLGDAHEVETISLFGTVEAGGLHPATRALVHRTKSGDEPIRAHSLRTEVIASAVATTSASLPGHHILAESELRLALRSLDVDLVILTEPTLTDFARQALDPTVAMAVVIDDPTAVVPDLVVADALIVPGPESANTVAEALGSLSPHIHVVPPHAWHTSTESPKDTVIAAVGSAPDRDVLGSVVDAFVELFPSNSEWSLNLASTGSEASALQLRAELAGVHGAVASSSRELMENDVLCRAAAIIVAAHDVGDAMASVLNGVACGSRVIVSTDNPDVEQLIREAPGAEPWTGSASRHIADILTTSPARIHDSSTKDWLQHWRRHAEQALLIAVDDVANVEDDNRIETLAERTLQARHRTEQAPPDSASSQSVRPLEDKLSGRHAGLVRWSGTLNEEHDSLLEPDVLARNLAFVASSLRAANIEFVVVSSPHEPGRIAVDAGLGRSAVEAIRAHGADVLVYTEHVDLTGQRRNRTLASDTEHLEHDAAIVAYTPVVSRTRSLRYGPAHGCTIEFWHPSTPQEGFTSPVIPTRRGKALTSLTADSTTTVSGVDYPTTHEIVARRLEDVDFPIDVVWAWVDDNDPAWRERRSSFSGSGQVAINGDDPSRFNNRDELRFSMRSVAMYAPWVRHLYIVTDQQRPSWLAEHPKVTVVDHRDIFTDASALPTFNSHAIESQLHHIEGLAETFLYFNDDVFLGRRVEPELFFTSTMQSKSFVSPTTIPPGPASPTDLGFYASRKNDRRLIEQIYDRTMVHGYLHTPHALRVSVLDEMEQRFEAQWANTQRSRFRSPGDIAIASSLHHAYSQMTDRAINGGLRSRYVKAGVAEHQALMRQILKQRNLDAFCLNDTADRDMDPDLQTNAMRAMLDAYFPMAAPWEQP